MRRILFGSYYRVYTGATNTPTRRSITSISLKESNEDVGHFFVSLYTGKDIRSNDWLELPIDDKVVKRVEELEKMEKQPIFDQYPMFEWAPGIPMFGNTTGY